MIARSFTALPLGPFVCACTAFLPLSIHAADEIAKELSQEGAEECVAKNYPIIDPCGKCAQLGPTGGPNYIITPNAGPCVFNGADLGIVADFIYWAFRPEGLDFLRISEKDVGVDSPGTTQGKSYGLNLSMSPGFKVGLSLIFDHDGWDAYGLYTWLHPHRHRHINDEGQTLIAGSFFPIEYTTVLEHSPISQADLYFSHQFNVVDFTLGRNFFISRYLKLHPFIGLKGTWQNEHIQGSADYIKVGSTDRFLAFSEITSHWWGVGVFSGLNMGWMMTRNISIAGNVGLTAMWRRFKPHLFAYTQNITHDTYNTASNITTTSHGVFPVIESSLGLCWEDWFRCEEFHYSIEALWELQWWSNRTDMAIPYGMGMQGLTLEFRFDF